MNRTLTCLLGLFLAAPMAAQHDHSERQPVEQHAAELLRLSAEKAAAGHQTAAAELALKAAAMLQEQAEVHRAHARDVSREQEAVERAIVELEHGIHDHAVEQKHGNQQIHEIIIVKDQDGNVIKLNGADLQLSGRILDIDKQLIELKALGYAGEMPGEMEFEVMVAPDGQHGGLFEIHEERGEHGDHDTFVWDTMDNHFTPMDGGDLHEEIRAIHHELKQLRQELRMLRSSMNGGQGRGNRDDRSGMWRGRWQDQGNQARDPWTGRGQGMWVPEGNVPSGKMHIMRYPMEMREPMEPMEPMILRERTEFPRLEMRMHGLPHDFNEQIHEEVMKNMGMHGERDMSFGFFEGEHGLDDGDFDFDFEIPEGMEAHTQIKVIINGEVYEGDEARKMLKEMQGSEGHSRMKMRVKPAPSEPPKSPSRGNWRRSEDHEDL